MDITQVPIDLWISQGVFCLLFLWLFWDTRKESKQREQMYMDRELRLSDQLDKQNIAQEKIVVSLQALEHQMTNLKG
ncbi:holin [Bacillus sp. SD075]|uniref:holin n=1 Tax=Bacillaceae TaxID=186817 RepID=UPI001A9576D1|nr:holin [Bacillus sp. SD075]MBO0997403.1 holin [Bacillus sp. SD075]